MSDYLENKICDHILRNVAYSVPSGIYIGLYTSAPSDAGGGVEASGGSYARVQVGPSASAWLSTNGTTSGSSSGTSGVSSNAADIVFPSPTGNWGTITHVGVFDAATSGNLLMWSALSASKVVSSGDLAPRFQANSLTVTFD